MNGEMVGTYESKASTQKVAPCQCNIGLPRAERLRARARGKQSCSRCVLCKPYFNRGPQRTWKRQPLNLRTLEAEARPRGQNNQTQRNTMLKSIIASLLLISCGQVQFSNLDARDPAQFQDASIDASNPAPRDPTIIRVGETWAMVNQQTPVSFDKPIADCSADMVSFLLQSLRGDWLTVCIPSGVACPIITAPEKYQISDVMTFNCS